MADNPQTPFTIAGAEAGRHYKDYFAAFMEQLGEVPPKFAPEFERVADRAFLIFYENALNAAYDQYGIPRPTANDPTDDDTKQCAECWCNSCGIIDVCTYYPAADGITPPPCAACWQTTPLVPCSEPPPCGKHDPSPPKCKACWCRQCATFEDCVVEKEDFDPEQLPCPCDGCNGVERWMPKEKPPCGKYAEREPDK